MRVTNCTHPGCQKASHTRGFCKRHYDMARYYGQIKNKDPDIGARLWENSIPIPFSGCYVWLGAVNWKGYGWISIYDYPEVVHRVAYKKFIGPIPKGLVIHHKCKVRCCWNPNHLEAVTNAENLRKGRIEL